MSVHLQNLIYCFNGIVLISELFVLTFLGYFLQLRKCVNASKKFTPLLKMNNEKTCDILCKEKNQSILIFVYKMDRTNHQFRKTNKQTNKKTYSLTN